jgi:hypothetical protein
VANLGKQTEALLSKGEHYKTKINELYSKHGLTAEQAA